MSSPVSASAPEFPTLLDAAEKESANKQQVFYVTTGAQLGLLAAAAITSLLPTHFAGGLGPVSTLILFLGALGLQAFGVANRAERAWYAARAAAESIKSAAWEFSVGGEAYRRNDGAAEARFREVLRQVLDSLPLSIGAVSTDNAGVTPTMKQLRASDRTARAAAYRTWRVDDQVSWYRGKAAANRKNSSLFGAAATLVESVAVVLGILRVNGAVDADYMSALAAMAAGLVGWAQAKKYSALSEAYGVTSHDVALVAGSLDLSSEAAWAQSVHDAEAAFSREHTMWLARRQGPI